MSLDMSPPCFVQPGWGHRVPDPPSARLRAVERERDRLLEFVTELAASSDPVWADRAREVLR